MYGLSLVLWISLTSLRFLWLKSASSRGHRTDEALRFHGQTLGSAQETAIAKEALLRSFSVFETKPKERFSQPVLPSADRNVLYAFCALYLYEVLFPFRD